MKKVSARALLFSVVLAVSVIGMWSAPASAESKGVAVLWPAGDIKWSESPAMAGAKIAVLWGDPKTGPYGALKSIPAGKSLAAHTHSHDQKVVVLMGTIVLTMDGASPKALGPGSYAFIPGEAKHTAECKAGAECTYFEEQPGASDVKWAH